jgi:CAAX prenyl protease-like protein
MGHYYWDSADFGGQIKAVMNLEGAWRYIIPFGFYIFIGDLTRILFRGLDDYHIYLGYILRTVIVGFILFKFRKKYIELSNIGGVFDGMAILLGTIIFALWIGLEGRFPTIYSSNIHYDPTNFTREVMMLLILIRLLGSVLVAPIIEELFIRSFLMRYIIDPDWEKVPIGIYTFSSFLIVTLFFGFSHFRWLPGVITAALLNLLLYKKKNIIPCIVAHASANLFLLIYVVHTNSWFYY